MNSELIIIIYVYYIMKHKYSFNILVPFLKISNTVFLIDLRFCLFFCSLFYLSDKIIEFTKISKILKNDKISETFRKVSKKFQWIYRSFVLQIPTKWCRTLITIKRRSGNEEKIANDNQGVNFY